LSNKYSNFHENPTNGSQVFPHGHTDGQTDKTKLLVAFRNFANSPKNGYELPKKSGDEIHDCKKVWGFIEEQNGS